MKIAEVGFSWFSFFNSLLVKEWVPRKGFLVEKFWRFNGSCAVSFGSWCFLGRQKWINFIEQRFYRTSANRCFEKVDHYLIFLKTILFLPLIWWNKIRRRNKYDEKKALLHKSTYKVSHVHNQKLLKIYMLSFILLYTNLAFR